MARMKSEKAVRTETPEIPIRFKGQVRWLTDLTRRTTCDDIVYALMHHEKGSEHFVDVHAYAIYEKWRGVERPLKGRTKILKVWRAWSEETDNVTFTLRKVNTPLVPCEIIKARKAKRSKTNKDDEPPKKTEKEDTTSSTGSSVHASFDATRAKTLEQLVQIVISQEKKTQEQLRRLKETDTQIEYYESKLHQLRIKENGANYVQEAYLKDSSDDSIDDVLPNLPEGDMDTYIKYCESIIQLDDKINAEEGKIHDLSLRIMDSSALSNTDTDGHSSTSKTELQLELDKTQQELHKSVQVALSYRTQFEDVERTLKESDLELTHKAEYLSRLQSETDHHNTEDTIVTTKHCLQRCGYNHFNEQLTGALLSNPTYSSTPTAHDRLRVIYAKTHTPCSNRKPEVAQNGQLNSDMIQKMRCTDDQDINDSSSDTGLSSLHSDEAVPILETLV